jgi:SAM-dependent methyltransferase
MDGTEPLTGDSLMTFLRSIQLRRRLFAWANAHSGSEYEDASSARRRALFGGLHGEVLEIGPGGGPNLRFYPPDVRWVGVEPNPFMDPYLKQAIQATRRPGQNFRVERGDPAGIRLPAGDASMDAVVSTLVLCSVPHPQDSLSEILRVLKPGGKFLFIEHVAAPQGTRLRKQQDFFQRIWGFFGDGCHPNRETWETIAQAGFARVELEHFEHPGAWLAGPQIAGTAYKGE